MTAKVHTSVTFERHSAQRKPTTPMQKPNPRYERSRKISVFGCSVGTAIALQGAHRPRYQGIFAGLVLDSQVRNGTEAIKANWKRTRLPMSMGPSLSCGSRSSRSSACSAYRLCLNSTK